MTICFVTEEYGNKTERRKNFVTIFMSCYPLLTNLYGYTYMEGARAYSRELNSRKVPNSPNIFEFPKKSRILRKYSKHLECHKNFRISQKSPNS